MTKITRIALTALVLAVVLAVSSFAAYSFNLDGTVNGLEDGVEYTAAKYDFATDTYGEFEALTDATALTPGIWGIKAGDAEIENVFASGSQSGHITFWNEETNLPAYNFAGVSDALVPGKWSVSSNGAFRTVQAYVAANEASACLYLKKDRYLQQVDGAWNNATPIEGEANLLQESVVKYGFAADEIVPAKDVNAITNAWLTIQTGGNALNTEKGYTKADIKGTFTFVVKTIGVEGYETYVVDIDAATASKSIAAPAAMAESEGYLVGFEFAPYANCPDDIFFGAATDGAAECYAHYGLNKGANVIDFDVETFPAPEGIVDGFGTFGGLDDGTYELAPVTINSDGTGFVYGAWEEFDPDVRTYCGLYAIKEICGERETEPAYAYAYGVHADRKALGELGGTNGSTVLVKGGQTFTPGYYSGNYTSYYTGTVWQIMSHGQIDADIMKASYNARVAYEALLADEAATEDAIAAAKATLDAKNTAVINALNKVNLKYAYAQDEIIPTKLVNSFGIKANQNNNYFTLTGDQQKKAVAYVADNTGKITTYEQVISQPFSSNLDFTVDFDEFLPEDGYLVAFEIYPCTNVTLDAFVKVTGTASFRYYTMVDPSRYSIDEPEALPVIGEKPEGLTISTDGIISGLDADETYEYTQYDIGGMLPEVWTVVKNATTIDASDMVGLIAVRYMGDGYTNNGSDIAVVYRPGGKRTDILNLVPVLDKNGAEIFVPDMVSAGGWNPNVTKFNEGKWTGMVLTNSLAVNYGFDPLILGTTDCPSGAMGVKEFQNGTYDSNALMENIISKVYYTYQYLPEEIIDMKFFESYTYVPALRQGAFRVTSGKVYTQFTLWVMTEEGNLEARTVYKEANMKNYDGNTQTVTLADFEKTDGYIVAIEIRPFAKLGEGTVITIPSGQEKTVADYTVVLKKDGYKVNIVLPSEEKPTGLEYFEGKIVGLDANTNYKFAQFDINGVAEVDYADIEKGTTEFETELVGLIAISKKGDGINTKDSDPVYVYIPAEGYDNILHTEDIVGTGGAHKDKTISVPLIVKAENDGIIRFTEGKWTGPALNISLQKGNGFDPLILGSTSVPGGTGTALKKAEDALAALGADATADQIAAAQATLNTEREKAATRTANIYYSYAYQPNEIIPTRDFVSYTFAGPRVRQAGIALGSGTVYTKMVLKVVTEDGELVDNVALKPVNFGWNVSTTFNASDFAEIDGYIVGIVIHPFGHIDGYYKANGTGTTSGDYNIILKADGYKVTRTLKPAEMTKLTSENGVVSGFDSKYAYEYAPYGINGVEGEWTTIEGDEFALTNVGLTAIRIKSDNVNYAESDPQVFYLAGKYSDRADVMEKDADGKFVNTKSADFIKGEFTATRLSYANRSDVGTVYTGANAILDQQVGTYSNVGDAERLWLLQRTKEEAQAALDAQADKQGNYSASGDGSYYPERLQGVIDAHYAKAHDIEAESKVIIDKIVNNYHKSYIRYAFTDNEILPVDQLKTLKFLNKTRQGAFEFMAQSRVNVYVMDENGEVTPYAWTSEFYPIARHTNYYHTINVQEQIDLPESGWIVGFEFIPYAVVDGSSVKSVANTNLAYKAQAWAFDQQHVVMGFYYDTYEIVKPAIDKPDYIEYADGKFTGLIADEKYAYGRFTAEGVEEVTEITGVTELEVPGVGVWGIQLVSDNAAEFANSAFVVGYNKDMTNARADILNLVDYTKTNGTVIKVPSVANAGTYSFTGTVSFNEGKWTGFSLTNNLTNHGFGAMTLGTTSCTISGTYATNIKNAVNDVALDAARKSAAAALAKVFYSYEYTAEEAIPMNEFISWSFESRERQGSLKVLEGSMQTKFVFKVVTEDGIVEDRVVYKNASMDGGTNINITINDFAETDGYIVGIVIYPYGNCPEGTILGTDGEATSEDLLVILGTDYTVVPAASGTPAATPVITMTNSNAVVTITNYNAAVTYAYSTNGGESWTAFEGSSFNATKANTQYVVKALESDFFGESEVSEAVTSPAITLVGRSLVLDGQIGVKVYFDIATDLVKTNTLAYYTTKVNKDYANYPSTSAEFTALYRQGDYVTMTRSNKWMTKFQLDEETGLYYVIFYVPAKDVDNTVCESQLDVSLVDGTEVTLNTMGIYPMSYIADAKALAEAGNEEFVAALPLVEALEAYLAYADNYFNNGEDAAYASTASTDGIEAATRTNATLEGVQFYGTSLLLEDMVTIRHYFAVEDIDAFNAAYDVAGKYGVKGNFIYFDIADIPAQEIGKVQTFTINDAEGNAVYNVTYSVANYIVDMMGDDDANLVSLVNAMYDYYLAAVDYTK